MNSYLVTYQVYVDADTPEDAAAEAYAVVSEPGYWDIPPTLGVRDLDVGTEQTIDLVPPSSPLGRMLAPVREAQEQTLEFIRRAERQEGDTTLADTHTAYGEPLPGTL